jgi:hypothetical protein
VKRIRAEILSYLVTSPFRPGWTAGHEWTLGSDIATFLTSKGYRLARARVYLHLAWLEDHHFIERHTEPDGRASYRLRAAPPARPSTPAAKMTEPWRAVVAAIVILAWLNLARLLDLPLWLVLALSLLTYPLGGWVARGRR